MTLRAILPNLLPAILTLYYKEPKGGQRRGLLACAAGKCYRWRSEQ